MAFDRNSMAQRFHDLLAERNAKQSAIDAAVGPLKAQRDALEAEFDHRAAEIDAAVAQHKATLGVGLAEIKSEMAIISRALDGKTAI